MSGSIDRQLGEIVATLSSMREDVGELKVGQKESVTERREENHRLREEQQAIRGRLEAVEREATERHRTNTEKLDHLTKEIAKVMEPVQQFIKLRRRVVGFIFAAGLLAAFIWKFLEPIYQIFLERIFNRH